MADELVLTGGEYIKDLTGFVWLDITDQGQLRVQIKETGTSEVFDVLNETCPVGKVWKLRVAVSITETDA